jgi:hypothetical protein
VSPPPLIPKFDSAKNIPSNVKKNFVVDLLISLCYMALHIS